MRLLQVTRVLDLSLAVYHDIHHDGAELSEHKKSL